MTTTFDDVQDFTRRHPLFATGVLITGLPILFSFDSSIVADHLQHQAIEALRPLPNISSTISSFNQGFGRPISARCSVDELAKVVTHWISAYRSHFLDNIISAFAEYLGSDLRHWTTDFPFDRLLFLVFTTLPGAAIFVCYLLPSVTSRQQSVILNALHLLGFLSLVNQASSSGSLACAALVMVAFDVFSRALDRDASDASESDTRPQPSSPAETILTRARSANNSLAESGPQASTNLAKGSQAYANTESGGPASTPNTTDSKERDVVRLQHSVADLKTANQAKEILLRSTRDELKNARDTLNTTFAEYCSLRDEMKSIRQNMARDHQAIVYRKDIELFALRKGNEQKEKYIMEHDAKLEEVFQQQKATVELKDAQLKMLKERLAFLENQSSPKFGEDKSENVEGDHALEVRLLKIKKGKAARLSAEQKSTDSEPLNADEEKDATIESLREQLTIAKKAAAEVVSQQGELQRAWDIAKKMQAALRQERELHTQTKEQLQEMAVKVQEGQNQAPANDTGRLPTIEEDKHELEAMFDTAQQDNLRLYAEIEALEKRLREANARMFKSEQETESLRQQIELEKTINSDLEAARPSVVHRVHFQRMEGQLKESRDVLASKNQEIDLLKKTIAGKDDYVNDLKAEVDAAVNFHTQDQDEIERLKQSVSELQSTKEQLMRDHERLASQRARQRGTTADRASARSSGATLIQESSPSLTRPSEEIAPIEALPPMPIAAEPEGRNDSIQMTPKRHMRTGSIPARLNLISNDAPPSELRGLKRRSLGIKDMMKRMVKKDTKPDTITPSTPADNTDSPVIATGKAALSTKDRNAILRPNTAAPSTKTSRQPSVQSPRSIDVFDAVQSPMERRHTPRYYAQDSTKENEPERPITSAGVLKAGEDEMNRPASRKSWGATNKLKRRSLY
ncbi:hypothetical protein FB567DRAFT_301072 [Paraphoma chrysanthemicola]|uniref:Uncharacterized protein n=1 Tax=Paraphoma chrysanthemicola TaxID=798071 RepID=A0A8K0RC04_9PLEO|nr:hypothetical protein FB567DRAFT_301072 [Paraphoma chrysanthemicola]